MSEYNKITADVMVDTKFDVKAWFKDFFKDWGEDDVRIEVVPNGGEGGWPVAIELVLEGYTSWNHAESFRELVETIPAIEPFRLNWVVGEESGRDYYGPNALDLELIDINLEIDELQKRKRAIEFRNLKLVRDALAAEGDLIGGRGFDMDTWVCKSTCCIAGLAYMLKLGREVFACVLENDDVADLAEWMNLPHDMAESIFKPIPLDYLYWHFIQRPDAVALLDKILDGTITTSDQIRDYWRDLGEELHDRRLEAQN